MNNEDAAAVRLCMLCGLPLLRSGHIFDGYLVLCKDCVSQSARSRAVDGLACWISHGETCQGYCHSRQVIRTVLDGIIREMEGRIDGP